MNFRSYLISKKIDPDQFKKNRTEDYRHFNQLFSAMSPNSFTQQKLFLINQWRRSFLLEKEPEEAVVKQVKKVKPKIVPKIKKD